MNKSTEVSNTQKPTNCANRELATVLIKSVINKDWNYMLSVFPEGVEHRAYKYTEPEHFSDWVDFDDFTRYVSPAQDLMIGKCLNKVIELLS